MLRDRRMPIEETALLVVQMTLTYESSILAACRFLIVADRSAIVAAENATFAEQTATIQALVLKNQQTAGASSCSVDFGLHGDAGVQSPPIVLRLSTPF